MHLTLTEHGDMTENPEARRMITFETAENYGDRRRESTNSSNTKPLLGMFSCALYLLSTQLIKTIFSSRKSSPTYILSDREKESIHLHQQSTDHMQYIYIYIWNTKYWIEDDRKQEMEQHMMEFIRL